MKKSLFKWMGSKKKLVPRILELLPKGFNTYHEPFMGSGVVFLSLEPTVSVCSDIFCEPIIIMRSIKNSPREFYEIFHKHSQELWENGGDYYYSIREYYNHNKENMNEVERAATFNFLLKSCFNGVIRFNPKKNNSWNVPWGKRGYKEIGFPIDNKEVELQVIEYSKFLNTGSKDFFVQSFDKSIEQAREGDLIYADPPYLISQKGHYSSWTKEDELLLFQKLDSAAKRGVHFVLSNVFIYKGEENKDLVEMYSEYEKITFQHTYIVNVRKTVEEILIHNIKCRGS